MKVSLPQTQIELSQTGSIFLSNKAPVPSHDAIYGGWTACPIPETGTTESAQENVIEPLSKIIESSATNSPDQNILVSSPESPEDESETPQKNKSHATFFHSARYVRSLTK